MPIPQEFNCNEVHLADKEIEAFQTAILNLSGIVDATKPFSLTEEVRKTIPQRDALNFSKAETAKIYAQAEEKVEVRNEKFLIDNRVACKNGLLALKNLPEGRDPKSMFAWVKQFPQLLWRDNLKLAFDRFGERLSLNEDDRQTINKNFELAKSWYDLFSSSRYFNILYGLPGLSADYERKDAKDTLKKFQAKAGEMNVPARDEELIAEETGAFDAGEEPAAEDDVLILEEIPKEEPKEEIKVEAPKEEVEVEMPAKKKKIEPINITEEIGGTENKKQFADDFSNFNSERQKIRAAIKAKLDHDTRLDADLEETIKKEFEAMVAGPKKHNFNGALEWLQKFPHAMAAIERAPELVAKYPGFSEEHADLAKEWIRFANDQPAKETQYGNKKITNPDILKQFERYEKSLYDKSWKAVHKAEKMKIDSIVEKLENAKTFYNSGEYNQIIDVAKMLYHTDELPKKFKDSATTPEARHAFKLASIKAQIDAYIDHKAKDGVKPNVYHKLAAVEELNRYVCEELNRIGVKNIPRSAPPVPKVDGQVPTCLAEEKGDMAVKNRLPNENMVGAEKEECSRALDCMGRILVHAGKLDVGFEKTYALNEMANAFQGGPNVDLDAPQEEPEVKLPDDDLVENGADLLG